MIVPRFLTALRIEKIGNDLWLLFGDLVYESAVMGARLVVPSGFKTDLASVPRLPLAYWLAGNVGHEPAVIHDFLYQVHLTPKRMADDIFGEALHVSGIAWWRARLMVRAVKIFGGRAWNSHVQRVAALNPEMLGTAFA